MARDTPASTNDHDTFQFAPLTEADVRAKVGANNFKGGQKHYRQGHIQEPTLHGATIEARCIGATVLPFEVQATLAKVGDAGANPSNVHCTCSQTGYCPHIVALLLAWVDDPLAFEVGLDIDALLEGKSREELVDLIREMAERYPEVQGFLETPLPLVTGEVEPAAPNAVTVSGDAVRRQVRSAFIGLGDDAGDPFGGGSFGLMDFALGLAAYNPDMLNMVTALGDIYTNAEQWANAQVVFTVLVDEVGNAVARVSDHQGYLAECLSKCDEALSLCLDAQEELADHERLDNDTRMRLIRTLYDIWHEDMYVLGDIDIAYEGPAAIARAVTDDERATVEEWLRGEPRNAWGQYPPVEFIVALRRQVGIDDEEILAMYRDAGMWGHVAMVLLSQDRVEEAVTVANSHLKDPGEFLGFADAMIERGGDVVSRALSMVDDRAWEIDGTHPLHESMLQTWLAQRYQAHDRPGEALKIVERRFRQHPSRYSFNAVRRVAELPGQEPDVWDRMRPTLVEHLREQQVWSALVELSLDEDDIDAALDAYANSRKDDDTGGMTEDLLVRLTDAVKEDHPDRAVELYRQLAEGRIVKRQRSHYRKAAKYLAQAKELLEMRGRTDDWRDLISYIREGNPTLTALREELDNLELH